MKASRFRNRQGAAAYCKHPGTILQIFLLPNPITTLLVIVTEQPTMLAKERDFFILNR
jgi:hypothetical protein